MTVVNPDDVVRSAAACRTALTPGLAGDWEVPAGDLEWSCARTLEHVSNALLRYTLHLASGTAEPLPRVRTHDPDLSVEELLALVPATAAALTAVAGAARPEARGFHPAGIADAEGFCAMGCDEILVHTHDLARGLALPFEPPADLAGRVRRRLFPWAPDDTPPWPTLLWANGRAALGERQRLDADWYWHCAPVDEWEGKPNRRTAPGRW